VKIAAADLPRILGAELAATSAYLDAWLIEWELRDELRRVEALVE
jgi:hypothetical protein